MESYADTQTGINYIGFIALLIGGIYILCSRTERLFPAFLIPAILIPMGQVVVIFGLHFTFLRIYILVVWLRILMRREVAPIKMSNIDWLIIFWMILRVMNYTIMWQTAGALVNRLGLVYDTLGLYFFFRVTIRNFQDLERIIKTLAWVCLILSVFVGIEEITKWNLFYILGGVPEITEMRDGSLRCQGPFAHPIMLGSFCASLVPIFLFYHPKEDDRRRLVIVGAIAAMFITVATASSGPVLTLFAGLIGLGFWPFRGSMKLIKWGILIAVVSLHIFMKAPVWALLNRVKVFGASTGYHRFILLDEFINRFDEWWLWGVRSTSDWGDGLGDLTNYFVRVGADGGLIAIILIIGIIAVSFRAVGKSMRLLENSKNMQKIIWSLGASLFAHLASFMGVSYFDQINVLWYMLLGGISSLMMFVTTEPVGSES